MSTPATPPATVARTLGLARPAARPLVGATALGAGTLLASIALMGTSAWLISRAAQHPSEAALSLAIVGVQFFGLSRGFCRYGERLVGHDAAFSVLADVRVRVYRRLAVLAPAGLPIFRRGDLLARTVDDVDALQDVVLRVIPPFTVALAVGVTTVAVVWAILPGAGAVLAVALLLAATAVPWLTGRLARRGDAQLAAVRGELSAAVVDLVEGAPELVVFGAVPGQLARVDDPDRRLRALSRRAAATTGVGLGLTTLLAGLACWGGLALGVGAAHAGSLDPVLLGTLALVPLAAFELVAPLPAAAQALERSRHVAGRVFEVTDAPAPVAEPDEPLPLGPGPHTLSVRALWAGHPGSSRPALRGVGLELPPGRRVAVVGPSGAGKTTLAEVLVRFLEPAAGEVCLDGHPLARYAGDDVRTVVGLVDQHPHLFATTLAENLRVARRVATDDELRAVLARVGLGPWLDALPRGLSTEVGQFGARLSGGQRQRVAVARALLAEFPVLVLDEPAEHLDPPAADALTADLLALTEGHSVLLITHRLAGLDAVDEVVVLHEGRVAERGTHAALVAAGGRYAGLWWEEQMARRPADEDHATPGPTPTEVRPEARRDLRTTEGSDRP